MNAALSAAEVRVHEEEPNEGLADDGDVGHPRKCRREKTRAYPKPTMTGREPRS